MAKIQCKMCGGTIDLPDGMYSGEVIELLDPKLFYAWRMKKITDCGKFYRSPL